MDSSVITGSTIPEPRDDIEFESHEAAYSFYKDYAKSVGFGTAKLSSRRSRSSKEFIDAKFSCIRYGNKQQSDDAINPRPSPKIGCKASMHVKRRQNGKWYIYSFVKEHNHELLPAQVHFFRSHRNDDPLKNDIRIRRRKSLSSVSKLFGAYQNVDCLEGYMRNQHDKGRSLVLESGDAQVLLDLFMHMQEENPKFFYAVDLNEEHRLRNLFWVDTKGMEDYSNFDDVVCFDTTYFTNKYKIPLVFFVGVNHHIQPTLLGCALIADETFYTFVWLMQTWFMAMGERAPQLMLTDQNNALKEAIGAVFPQTCHCFCLWHILEKIPRQLEYLSLWHDNFMVKFNKCIFKSWTEEQFEKRWGKLLDKFNLREVEWLQSLYGDRKYWVPTFMRDVSFAGLSTMSRSESLTSSYDKYVHAETSMREFIEQYKTILEDRYEEEAKADFDAWHETAELKSPSPFEKQMSLVYTHEIFRKFQVEVLGAAACHLKKESQDETTTMYTVKDFEDSQNYVVEWNETKSDIYCSCRSFEYKGYLCRHAIVVLQMSGVFSIPPKYVLQRWTNAALSRHPISERLDEVQTKVRRYNDLCRRAIILGEEGSLSQESYNIALCAIREALKQCASLNNSAETSACPNTSGSIEEENQYRNTSKERAPDLQVTGADKATRRAGAANTKESNHSSAVKKGKQVTRSGDVNVGGQEGFHLMGISDLGAVVLNASWVIIDISQFVYIISGTCGRAWTGFSWKAFQNLWSFVRLSLASAVMLCLEVWYFMALILFAGYLKNAEVAVDALSICMNILGWTVMVAMGMNAAISVRISNELGAAHPRTAKFSLVVAVVSSFIIGLIIAAILIIFRKTYPSLFSSDVAVQDLVRDLTPLLALCIVIDNVQPVLSGVAIGAGWQAVVAYVNIACYYIFGIPLGLILGFKVKLGVKGIWYGMLSGTVLQTLILFLIIYKTNWNKEASIAEDRIRKWGGDTDIKENSVKRPAATET